MLLALAARACRAHRACSHTFPALRPPPQHRPLCSLLYAHGRHIQVHDGGSKPSRLPICCRRRRLLQLLRLGRRAARARPLGSGLDTVLRRHPLGGTQSRPAGRQPAHAGRHARRRWWHASVSLHGGCIGCCCVYAVRGVSGPGGATGRAMPEGPPCSGCSPSPPPPRACPYCIAPPCTHAHGMQAGVRLCRTHTDLAQRRRHEGHFWALLGLEPQHRPRDVVGQRGCSGSEAAVAAAAEEVEF